MAIKTLTLAVAALAAGTAVASAQPAQAQDPHHPGTNGASTTQTQPATPPAGQPGGPAQPGGMPMRPGGQGVMMGGDMAQMMTMMQMMQDGMMPMGLGARGGDPFRHIEGQIAYYKAELKITDAQATEWNAFADALRTNATHLQQAMMKAKEAQGSITAPEQMERRIAMLTELRGAMQTMLAAAKPLYATLSDEQKKVADELMTEHMMRMRARGM